MGIFSFVNKTDNKKNIIEKKETVEKSNVFGSVFEIYDIINSRPSDYKKLVNQILEKHDDSEVSFMVYILNHYLIYNDFTRNFIELFTMVSGTFLSSNDYINFYVDFMIYNKINFPKYMSWYKLSLYNNTGTYKDLLKEKYKLNDEDIEEVLSYFNNKNISIRDICLTIL